jgi:hypothetical protein
MMADGTDEDEGNTGGDIVGAHCISGPRMAMEILLHLLYFDVKISVGSSRWVSEHLVIRR